MGWGIRGFAKTGSGFVLHTALKSPEPHIQEFMMTRFSPAILSAQCMGDATLINEVCNVFLELFPGQLNALQLAINQEDIVLTQKELHKIKGTIGVVCLPEFRESISQLEATLKTGKIMDFKPQTYMAFESLKELLEEAKQFQIGKKI